MLKFILVILDGFGLRAESEGNAARLAHTPTLDRLLHNYPMIPLETSGKAVGLPDGVMGNSEVGHMNMGAGRIVQQDLVRIDNEIEAGRFHQHPQLLEQMRRVSGRGGVYHIMGLCSEGGVHSQLTHLRAILELAKAERLTRLCFHAFMDGRDTSPRAGQGYLKQVTDWMKTLGVGVIATVVGRYFAMDRDQRWDRTENAYRMLVYGAGQIYPTVDAAIQASYAEGIGDEFVQPAMIGEGGRIVSGDALLAMNFRADRMRQIIRALTEPDFTEFPVGSLDIDLRSMTRYDDSFSFPTLYPRVNLTNTFPEVLSRAGYRQLRLAETEKYAHVTYFFNGGNEQKFPGEDRILIPSPRVATYDLKPSMSIEEVGDRAVEAIESGAYEGIILNIANPDMVGHTGKLGAAISAMEHVDREVGRILAATQAQGAALFLTADHGNVEMMIDPETGHPHTTHTTLEVPLVMVAPGDKAQLEGVGKLADIAPTILTYLDMDIPPEMTGINRLVRKPEHAT